jgi:polysaccharide export outer membrane protein
MKGKISFIILFIYILFNLELLYAQSQNETEYTIYPNDLLEITVYEEPDLTKIVRVSQDGTITYPLLGNVKAAGLTVKQLEEKLKELLEADYLVNAQVSVFVKEHAKISVLGQVREPKSYELKGGLTLLGAIALAGGFTDQADPQRVKVIRREDGQEKTMLIDTLEITENADRTKDILLKPDDVIIIEEYGRITIFGQVVRPGAYPLKKNLTLLEAIALAGGFTSTADIDRTRIVRLENGKKRTIRVRVSDITKRGDKSKDIILKPNDTIIVPESFF